MLDIGKIKNEYDEILKKLSDPKLIFDWENFEKLTKRKNFLEKIIEKEKEIKDYNPPTTSSHSSFRSEWAPIKNKIGKEESQAVIVEIRAGTGGEEAALFSADLFRMYSKYADSKNWKKTVLDCHYSDLGGIKQIIFELKNGNIFSKMKYEGGVHRVQRIPRTEKTGRIHTSTSSVAVLPKPKIAEIKIRPEELKIDFYRASGPGGQYVNRRETAVRITHLPSGIVVTSQTERNQLQNKENAMSILEARLLEKREMAEEEKIAGKRRSQIKWAKRAEKIRTYNFPQDRLTDHRLQKSWHKLERILDGELDVIIKCFQKKKNEATEGSEAQH